MNTKSDQKEFEREFPIIVQLLLLAHRHGVNVGQLLRENQETLNLTSEQVIRLINSVAFHLLEHSSTPPDPNTSSK